MKMLPVLATAALIHAPSTIASTPDHGLDRRIDEFPRNDSSGVVYWIGSLRCADGSHRDNHSCDLVFLNESDRGVYAVNDNPAIMRSYCSHEHGFRAKIVAELSPKTAFGGHRLTISRFEFFSPGEKLMGSWP